MRMDIEPMVCRRGSPGTLRAGYNPHFTSPSSRNLPMHLRRLVLLSAVLLAPLHASADMSVFTNGPAINGYVPVAAVPGAIPIPAEAAF